MTVLGVDILIKVNTGTTEIPVWTAMGGQKEATLTMNTEEIDTTSKDSDGWKDTEIGVRNWSIKAGALLVASDAAYGVLEDAYFDKEKVMVQMVFPSGATRSGTAILTELTVAGADKEGTASATLNGSGALTKTTAI